MPDLYVQQLDPLGNVWLSTALATTPVLVLLIALVGLRWRASFAGLSGALTAFLVAVFAYDMPAPQAGWAFVYGVQFGLLPIGWTVFAAMLLYNLTVETGQFAVIRRSIGTLSPDARIQAVLVGFAFGAFLEGSAGTGIPVAICGAMLVGLGVPAFRAAVICLIANTSPVCYGGLGTPVLTLSGVTGIPADTISVMCGHQLPILSCLIPFYMVKCLCTWRETFAVWPAVLVGGVSFATFQYLFATLHVWIPGVVVWPMTDLGGGAFSLITLALFLKYIWNPNTAWQVPPETIPTPGPDPVTPEAGRVTDLAADLAPDAGPLSTRRVAIAWSPFALMGVCLALAGVLRQAEQYPVKSPVMFGPIPSFVMVDVPTLHNQVVRAEKLRQVGKTAEESREAAQFNFNWATAPGTAVFLATLISAACLGATRRQMRQTFTKTVRQMAVPIPTIASMIGLSYITKYAGIDATLGVAFAATGALYPFFAAILGWLGVFLTGTDAGSNALFGSLQKITAGQVFDMGVFTDSGLTRPQAEVLITTANSTGGVMGKMIDAQSICVATAGTNQVGREADLFKAVVGHSIFLACIVGGLVALQAYVWPFTLMVPGY